MRVCRSPGGTRGRGRRGRAWVSAKREHVTLLVLPAAGVAELADAHGSGPCWLRLVWVRVPPPAPLFLAVALLTVSLEAGDEAKVSLDLKDADATEIVSVLAGAAEKQPVFNAGISCRVTLRVKEVPWRKALDTVLRACSLGADESGSVLRVAPIASLTAEQAQIKAL